MANYLQKRGQIFYIVKRVPGQPTFVRSLRTKDEKLAIMRCARWLERLEHGEGEPADLTVQELFARVGVADWYPQGPGGRYKSHGQHAIEHLEAEFGSLRARKVTPDDVRDWIRAEKAKRSLHSIAMDVSIARKAWNRAKLAENPWRGQIKQSQLPARERVLEFADQERFLAMVPPRALPAIRLMLEAGLRLNEIPTVKFQGVVVVVTGKGGKIRRVPWKGGPMIMPKCSDKYLYCQVVQACDRAGIERISPHDLRRTFGTRCAEAGISPYRLQRWMGHANLQTTMKYYVKLDDRNSAADLDRVTQFVTQQLKTADIAPKTAG